LSPTGDRTEAEIVNKPIFEFLMFSPHWNQILLTQNKPFCDGSHKAAGFTAG
jgi:hypothetical protein